MDPTEVHEDTNQRTRLVEDDENLTSAPCCAPANQQFCSRKLWVFHDIEATIRDRKCPSLRRIIKWIVHLIFWLIAMILVLGAFTCIGGFLFGIGYLFYLGTTFSVYLGMVGVFLVLSGLCWVDETFHCGVSKIVGQFCEYLMDTSDMAESKIHKI